MITQQDYQKNFSPHETPNELVALLDFQNDKAEWYSGRFQLMATRELHPLNSHSSDKEFENALKYIAQTSSSGTMIFFWICDASKELKEQPIVIFGDEGGFGVVFENLNDLLRYLTFDQSMYNETFTELQFIADDYVPNPRKEEYAKWLLEKFNLETVTLEDIETLSQNVQDKYAILFADWMKKYYN
jgi:hypothetical protein